MKNELASDEYNFRSFFAVLENLHFPIYSFSQQTINDIKTLLEKMKELRSQIGFWYHWLFVVKNVHKKYFCVLTIHVIRKFWCSDISNDMNWSSSKLYSNLHIRKNGESWHFEHDDLIQSKFIFWETFLRTQTINFKFRVSQIFWIQILAHKNQKSKNNFSEIFDAHKIIFSISLLHKSVE